MGIGWDGDGGAGCVGGCGAGVGCVCVGVGGVVGGVVGGFVGVVGGVVSVDVGVGAVDGRGCVVGVGVGVDGVGVGVVGVGGNGVGGVVVGVSFLGVSAVAASSAAFATVYSPLDLCFDVKMSSLLSPPPHSHQSAVQEVEDVVDASFVEELERASITRPVETRGSGKEFPGTGASATQAAAGSKEGRWGMGAGRGRGGQAQKEKGGGGGEGEEDWAQYKKIMGPLQVCVGGRVGGGEGLTSLGD